MARASANYTITATDKTKAAMNSVKGGFKDIDSIVGKVTGGMSLFSAVGVGTFAAIYKAQAPVIDRLAKTADKLGITTQALQAMRDAAKRAGITNENLDISMQRMTRRVAEAAGGTGEAVKALDALGLSAQELVRLSPDQMFAKISDSLEGVENQSQKVALAFKFFDSGGVDLVRLTTAAVEDAKNEMDALGISITRIDAKQVEASNDALQRMQRNASGVASQFTAQLAPAVTSVVTQMLTLDTTGVNVRNSMIALVDTLVDVIGFLGNGVSGISAGFDAIVISAERSIIAMSSAMNTVGLVSDTMLANMRFINDEKTKLLADKVNGPTFWEQLKLDVQSARTEAIKASADIKIAQETAKANPNNLITLPVANKPTKPEEPLYSTTGADAIGPAQAFAQHNEEIASEFAKVQELYRSDTDAIILEFERKKAAIDAYATGGTDEQVTSANELLFKAERDKQAQLTEIERAGWTERQKFAAQSTKAQTKQVLGEMAALTAGVSQSNRQMFELNKAAGIGNAIISTYEGVTKSLASYPWPIAGVMAATHLAAGMAQVQAIRSTSFGSGGSAPSIAGTSATASTTTSYDPTTSGTDSDSSSGQIIVVNNYGSDFMDNDAVDNATTESLKRATGDDKISWKNGQPIFNAA